MVDVEVTSLAASTLGAVWWQYIARNWAMASMFVTFLFIWTVSYLILRKYVRLMLNIIRDTPPPLAMGPRDFERIDGERVAFRAFDNLNLCGMLLRGNHGGAPRGMIIFSHEFSSDMYSCARYCRPLLASGYDVFSFDYRGHGESSHEPGYQPRQWPSEREVNDMLGAIAYVEELLEREGRPPEIGLFGISRGAGAAILASVNNPRVKAIVADGAFSSDTVLEHLMKRWAYIFAKVRFVYENHPPQFWRFLRWMLFRECRRKLNCTFPSVRKALRGMSPPRPILFIHGERDSYIPVEQSQLLYEAAPGPKSLWVVPGAKHNQCVIVRPEYYALRTVSFFGEYLAAVPSGGKLTGKAAGAPSPRTPAPTVSAESQPRAGIKPAAR
ncbi:MAG: alpha/beta fold hydrolase [Planctomycetes bacterium]|nr:alpha/beta fold hydrolase [Planctomycetota bacterium]